MTPGPHGIRERLDFNEDAREQESSLRDYADAPDVVHTADLALRLAVTSNTYRANRLSRTGAARFTPHTDVDRPKPYTRLVRRKRVR